MFKKPRNLLSFQTTHAKTKKQLENVFRPLFCHFWPKFVAIRSQKSLGHKIFFATPFELFCKIFGHLATVHTGLNVEKTGGRKSWDTLP